MQGFAAATMMNCEQSHSHEAKNLAEGHSHATHSGHDEATKHEAIHEHIAGVVDNNDLHHSTSTKQVCSHCGTCKACCASTAIVASSLKLPTQFDSNNANLIHSAPQFTSFVSAGLERPPRFILV